IEKIVCAKGSTDLCSNSLGQRIAYRFASTGRLDEHVALLAAQYKKKRDVMLDCMEKYFPEGVSWTRPEGGFFIWVTFPKGISAREILLKAIERKVAFVDGSGFYVNGNGKNTGRFAFSESSPEEIEKGIANLGEILREELQAREIVPCPDRRLA
ncbi:MAG TPA: aminotransferase class I/II-fold pyridoxal phosphate-dependent enzyme, partial [Firmicutes bacterium]|nr:aminotransferase class I/II-fold pyridoxal phosphate-dependent enzyme [Bacillota bacterium]